MALALVRSLDQSGDAVVLDVDTGTNPLYRVRLGRQVHDDHGTPMLDDVFWQSPWGRNERAGRHLDTRVRVVVPISVVEPRCLVQVVTAKDGPRAVAYSSPRRVHVAPALSDLGPGLDADGLAMSTSVVSRDTHTAPAFATPTMISVRSARTSFSRPASLDDLLGSLVQAALPWVQQLLASSGAVNPAAGAAGGSTGQTPSVGDPNQLAATIAALLRAALSSAGIESLARPQSFSRPAGNRFHDDFAAPFLFGIDDALLASLAGPVLSAIAGPLLEKLPELLNSANQHRLDSRSADHQLINQLVTSIDRNRFADRIASLGSGVPASGQSPPTTTPDLSALLELLRTATAATGGGAPATTSAGVTAGSNGGGSGAAGGGAARTQSLPGASTVPSRVQLIPESADPVAWLGRPRAVFVRDRAVNLRWRLDTGTGGPSTPLPRAILRVVIRRTGGGPDLHDREERLTDVSPGSQVGIQLEPGALEALPADTELEVFAQLRWPTAAGSRQCTSSQVLILSRGAYVVAAGGPAGKRVELADMTRFRPFWNKVWSSPPPGADRPLWGIDVTMRYSVVLADAPANALMEVRALAGEDGGGLRTTTTGRMRSGLQLSVHELAKLRALWPETPPLDATALTAFTAPEWLATQGGDAEIGVRFDGRRHTRGLVWVVPVPTLRSFTVARARDVDPHGQVLAVDTSDVVFPVVEAVRVLGLVSTTTDEPETTEPGPMDTGSAYAFEGYQVVHDILVGLEPVRSLPAGGA